MAPWTKVGQTCLVNVEAFQDRTFTGKVWRISPTVDQTKRTFVAEVLIDNPHGELKPGSYARARLQTQKIDQIRVVPVRGVIYILGSNKAFVIKDGSVEARDIKLGDRLDQQVEVVEGLAPGEEIATSQLNRLDTGAKVEVVTGEEKAAKPSE
jgi:membrane fusion protein (multidrug efflux system)